jgi:hypothetical protein
MDALEEAIDGGHGYPSGLFWFNRGGPFRRWGLSMSTKLTGGPLVTSGSGSAARSPRRPPMTLQFTANHTMVFVDKIVIRPELDPVNLLEGGAIGIGGGRTRHQIDSTASLNSGGTGIRMGLTWRGKSELLSRINGVNDTLDFSPVFILNLKAFTDMKRFFPNSDFAKGLRLSIDALNLTNDRQSVRDSFGDTPLQYQPGYRDPLGRTIEIEIRKVF